MTKIYASVVAAKKKLYFLLFACKIMEQFGMCNEYLNLK